MPVFRSGLPSVNNANYIWINLFYAALNPTGRAGFVMANSASDAGSSERELRKKLIETGSSGLHRRSRPQHVLTVTLPVTLWFLDKGKAKGPRRDKVLFVNARHLFRQVTRAHRTFDADHIEFIGNIVRLWRGENIETEAGSGHASPKLPRGSIARYLGCARSPRARRIETGLELEPRSLCRRRAGQHDDEEFKESWRLQEELECLNAAIIAYCNPERGSTSG